MKKSNDKWARKMLGQYFKGTKRRKITYPNGDLPSKPLRRNKNYKENIGMS